MFKLLTEIYLHLIDIYFCTGLRWLISRQLSFDLDSAGTFLYSYYSWWLCWCDAMVRDADREEVLLTLHHN